ncbi:MAG: hypothetical protein M1820_003649 [Bogoriella megaspora]|nr:MAG: hypothetical protein M1820_003649 [Bogoriella megaspora]
MLALLCYLQSILLVFSFYLLWTCYPRHTKASETRDTRDVASQEHTKNPHELIDAYADLVKNDGAGRWPPRAKHHSWPCALRPYHDIYLELAPLLSNEPPSLDDEYNTERRNEFRSRMRKLLNERIDVAQVRKILLAVEAGNWDVIDRDVYNGFYSCVAVSRHAYRWATIPVVKVAQQEKFIDFPLALAMPWPFLQRNFGVTAESGNHTSNLTLNYDEWGNRVYWINVSRSDEVISTEGNFNRMVYSVEERAVPAYRDMIGAVLSFTENDRALCLACLRGTSWKLREILKSYFDNMTDARVSRAKWMSYVQGFQAWAAGEMVNGEYVEYDGLSGNHVLFFQALDAFLGFDRYLSDVDFVRYIPARQRNLCTTFRKHSFRHQLKPERDAVMLKEFETIVFRMAHRKRSMTYLQAPAPERLIMTAGKSVLEVEGCNDLDVLLKPLEDLMTSRLKATV